MGSVGKLRQGIIDCRQGLMNLNLEGKQADEIPARCHSCEWTGMLSERTKIHPLLKTPGIPEECPGCPECGEMLTW
ncbi:MAG: hypothetical protein ACUZ8H_16285 [Candidatus Anammoxibacter sp.]